MRAELKVLSGKATGRTAVVRPGEQIAIGRATECDLQINTEGVSRRHCLVVGAPEGFKLVDLGSRNGVVVNGKRIAGDTPLADGDQLEIARNLVIVQVLNGPEPAKAAKPPAAAKAKPPVVQPDTEVPSLSAPAPASAKVAPPAPPPLFTPPSPPAAIVDPPPGPSGQAKRLSLEWNESDTELPAVAVNTDDPLLAAIGARSIGPFRLERRLGRGGVGMVFRATDERHDRVVALKVLKQDKANKAYHAERFRQECALVSALEHPGIVKALDHGRAGELYYLAMEYVEGPTLEKVRRERKTIAIDVALDWTGQILAAVGHAHQKGIIHRDLKPDNVILMPDGRTKLIDFGIGRLVTSESGRLTIDATSMGTRHYMPPEQIRDTATVDHRADLYAVAVMLFQFIAGELPFPKDGGMMAEVKAILESPPRRLRDYAADAPISIERFVERGLAKLPTERFQNAEQMLLALRLVGRRGE